LNPSSAKPVSSLCFPHNSYFYTTTPGSVPDVTVELDPVRGARVPAWATHAAAAHAPPARGGKPCADGCENRGVCNRWTGQCHCPFDFTGRLATFQLHYLAVNTIDDSQYDSHHDSLYDNQYDSQYDNQYMTTSITTSI
jgi:hypothetical protein